MWKCWWRGVRGVCLRGTYERGADKGSDSQTKQCQRFSPRVLDLLKCGRSDSDKRQKKWRSPDPTQSWFIAFRCSSALALGWALAHPCLLKTWSSLREKYRHHSSQNRFLSLLSKTVLAHPPVIGIEICNEENSPAYGPKTAEQTLDEAANDFLAVHNSITSEVENRRGVDLITSANPGKAFELFVSAARRGYPPAAFNLAQCYELGIGTKQNFVEAAVWYGKAADSGHPTALYNLAVFHAHGWGGLEQSTKKARKLLIAAAQKGQPEAKAALGVQSDEFEEVPSISSELTGSDRDQMVDISSNPDELYKLASSYESTIDDDPITPQLVFQLYKLASDFGHREAQSQVQLLQNYDTLGLLPEFLKSRSHRLSVPF